MTDEFPTAVTVAMSRREVVALHMADGASADLLVYRATGDERASLLWVPALGGAARHYEPLAPALNAQGFWLGLQEWRGLGSSDRRASRQSDWGYRELLTDDL